MHYGVFSQLPHNVLLSWPPGGYATLQGLSFTQDKPALAVDGYASPDTVLTSFPPGSAFSVLALS